MELNFPDVETIKPVYLLHPQHSLASKQLYTNSTMSGQANF